MSERLLLVLPIDDMSDGATYAAQEPLPLHCTVMHYFTRGPKLSMRDLDTGIGVLASSVRQPLIELVSRKRGYFGEKNDVPVHVLEHCEPLILLHNEIFAYLVHNHCRFPIMKWVGAGYRPHVADRRGAGFEPGQRHVAQRLALIQKDERGDKCVLATYGIRDFLL